MIWLLPLTVTWLAGAALLLLDGRRRWVTSLAAAAQLAVLALDVGLLLHLQLAGREAFETTTGAWPAGIGIRLRVDALSLLFGAVCTAVLTAVLVREARASACSRLFPGLVLLLSTGLHGAFFTGDLFDFYVFFELAVVASFALAAYGYGRAEIRATFIYIALNLLGSVLFVIGIASIYYSTGTLDLAQIAGHMTSDASGAPLLPSVLLLVALSLKLGMFPFHGWVPVLYSHARPAVAAAMSGALVNIGIYGLLRIGFTAASSSRDEAAAWLASIGAVAALWGGVLTVARRKPAEFVAYASIAQAGYVVLALGAGGVHGIVAILLTSISGSFDKGAMMLAIGGSGPARSFASFVAACSVAGLPITVGFAAKVELLRAALAGPAAWATAPALLLSTLLVLAGSFRFWRLMRSGEGRERSRARTAAVLAVLSVVLGCIAAPLTELGASIGEELLGDGP